MLALIAATVCSLHHAVQDIDAGQVLQQSLVIWVQHISGNLSQSSRTMYNSIHSGLWMYAGSRAE